MDIPELRYAWSGDVAAQESEFVSPAFHSGCWSPCYMKVPSWVSSAGWSATTAWRC